MLWLSGNNTATEPTCLADTALDFVASTASQAYVELVFRFWHALRTSDSCLMCDYARVKNFRIIIIGRRNIMSKSLEMRVRQKLNVKLIG